jgi:hypothetical protein
MFAGVQFMSNDKNSKDNDKLLYCSFCGKSQHEVRKLIAGPEVYVCDECVELCNDIIKDELLDDSSSLSGSELPKPKEIKKELDGYVYGWFTFENVSLSDIEKAGAHFKIKPHWNDKEKCVVLQLSAGSGIKDVFFLQSQSFKEKEPF